MPTDVDNGHLQFLQNCQQELVEASATLSKTFHRRVHPLEVARIVQSLLADMEAMASSAATRRAENERLRIALCNIARAQFGIGPCVDADSLFEEGCGLQAMAARALEELDREPVEPVIAKQTQDQRELERLRRYEQELTRASERLERFFGRAVGLLQVADRIDEVLTQTQGLVDTLKELMMASRKLLASNRQMAARALEELDH